MPDFEHELPIYVIRHAPKVARAVVRSFLPHVAIADDAVVRFQSTNFVDIAPVDYHSDGVVTFGDPVARTLLVEVQRRKDKRKKYSWTQYLAKLFAEHEAPVDLIVFAESASVARWARQPIEIGSGICWTPTVIGPDELASPQHRTAMKACPELAVLAMQLCQGAEPIHQDIVTDTARWLSQPNELADDDARLYRDIVRNAVSGVTRKLVEDIMSVSNQPFESIYFRRLRREWNEEGREVGQEEGREAMAESLVTVLTERGFALSDDHLSRIRSCTDMSVLKEWIRKAITAASVDDAIR